jgi:uncharacterized protein YdcH (DUF465 family)
VNSASERVDVLETSVVSINGEIENLKKQVNESNPVDAEAIAALDGRVGVLENEVTELKNADVAINDLLDAHEAHISTLYENHSNVSEEINTVKASIEELNNSFT